MAKRPVKKVKTVKAKIIPKQKTRKKAVAVKKNKKLKLVNPLKKLPSKKKPKLSTPKKIGKPKKPSKKVVKTSMITQVKKPIVKSVAAAKKSTVTKKTNNKVAPMITTKPTVEIKKPSLPHKPKIKNETPIIIPPHEEHDENYMNEAQKNHFRQILRNWKQELLEEMERTVHHMQDDATVLPDPNDRATQEEEFSLELRARDRELKLIKKIEEALERIDNNDYGFCEACGVEIGVKRLEARPTATLCIDCKTIDEIREKHFS
jgi:DnaK suppressor protein